MTDFEKKINERIACLQAKGESKTVKTKEEDLVNSLQKSFMDRINKSTCNSKKITIDYTIPNNFSYEPYTDEFIAPFGKFTSIEDIEEFVERVIKLFPSRYLTYEINFTNSNSNDFSTRGFVNLSFCLDLEKIKKS